MHVCFSLKIKFTASSLDKLFKDEQVKDNINCIVT